MISFFQHTHIRILGFSVLFFVLFVSFSHYHVVKAGVNDNLTGYAWSNAPDGSNQSGQQQGPYGTGVGWISMNAHPDFPSPVPDYGVHVDTTTGVFSGYAYSALLGGVFNTIDQNGNATNISVPGASGYINFQPSGSHPSGPGTTSGGARLDISTGQISGWARACGAFQSGCSGSPLPNQVGGGWDGWISLRGSGYGVSVVNYNSITGEGELTGFAWGSTNLGWISFDGVRIQLDPDITTSAPRLAINAGCYITGQPLQVDWATFAVQPESCTITSQPTPAILNVPSGIMPATSGMESGNMMTTGPINEETTFVLSCLDLNGDPVSRQTISTMCPANQAVVNLSAQCTVNPETTLSWGVAQATSCTTNIPGLSISLNNGSASGSIGNIPVSQQYNISCQGQDGNWVTRTVYPTQSQQCSVGPGGGLIRPGFQEI